jgi:hypothetical protein
MKDSYKAITGMGEAALSEEEVAVIFSTLLEFYKGLSLSLIAAGSDVPEDQVATYMDNYVEIRDTVIKRLCHMGEESHILSAVQTYNEEVASFLDLLESSILGDFVNVDRSMMN